MNKELPMPVVIAVIAVVLIAALAAFQYMNRPPKDMHTAEEYLRGRRLPAVPAPPAAPPVSQPAQPEKK